jgi:PPOX class probable F420-dependent enzyme
MGSAFALGHAPLVPVSKEEAMARQRRYADRPLELLDARLARESVAWLSTLRPDGHPHLVPIWFSWDGEALLTFSKPEARKVANIRHHPEVMIAVGEPEDDLDVDLIEARAEPLPATTAEVMPPSHAAKYAAQLRRIGVSIEEYVSTYSQPVRIVPTRFLGWTGRSRLPGESRSGAPAAA